MKGDKRVRWFFQIRGAYYARSAIMAVKRIDKTSVGRDNVQRNWIITLSPDVVPDPKYRQVWASDDEAAELVEMLEAECGKLERINSSGNGVVSEKPF